ncbi:hypothetical protein CHS0354_037101 [Potamilus streckersoni]|uniref:Beta-sarcoglycan n=1 Tax=Potamilus streckersoni TaxID=2493646 RepID=A0AAE0RPS7_9BIVA|nr:hypothetical protein CHS0354_037101 [Potamilus streckersoni]
MYVFNGYTYQKKDLQIVSSRDVKLQGIPDSDTKQTSLHIGQDGIIATCDSFEVQDKEGKRKLLVTDTEVQYHTEEVVYTGKAVFDGSVETPLLRGPITDSLRLESASSSIMLSGPEGISVQAPAGNILIKSSNDISIQADNKIFFNSTSLFLKNVPVSSRKKNGHTYAGVYQLCMCENGRLFLVSASGECVPTKTICD